MSGPMKRSQAAWLTAFTAGFALVLTAAYAALGYATQGDRAFFSPGALIRGVAMAAFLVIAIGLPVLALLRVRLIGFVAVAAWAVLGAAIGFLLTIPPNILTLLFGDLAGDAEPRPAWLRVVLIVAFAGGTVLAGRRHGARPLPPEIASLMEPRAGE
jgi:hypothetical protein